jgi:hypothetical protein
MLTWHFFVMLNATIEVWVTEDCCVILLYCGVPEEYSCMQSTEHRIVDIVYVSSCYPCLLQFHFNIQCIETDVSFLRYKGFAFYLPVLERWLNVTV